MAAFLYFSLSGRDMEFLHSEQMQVTVIPNEAGRVEAVWVRNRREAILPAGWRAFPTDYVYIVTNRRERLDIGVTNELERCVCELGAGFSSALPAIAGCGKKDFPQPAPSL